MEKILLAIDAHQINTNVIDFACFIAKLTRSKLTGIFLDNGTAPAVPVAETVSSMENSTMSKAKEGKKQLEEGISFFKDACTNKGSNCAIHLHHGVPVADIIRESRYADLLIVDPDMSLTSKKETAPTGFIKEVLAKSECPVVIAPFSFYGIDEILFAYDGSAASVFAIKQFTYLFPELTDKKMTILQVNEKEENPVIEKDRVRELLQMHYSSIGFQLLHGNAANELFGYLLGKKNVFVVMGAFGRSMLSGFFKHSTAELVVKTINLPVFIAHHK
jgi:nucleotide-binding universal stress UspA family protein